MGVGVGVAFYTPDFTPFGGVEMEGMWPRNGTLKLETGLLYNDSKRSQVPRAVCLRVCVLSEVLFE